MTRLYAGGEVGLKPASGCASCGGTCMWKRLDAGHLRVPAPAVALEPGDHVEVRLPAGYALTAALVAYGLPLAGLLAGAALAALAIDSGDLAVFAGAAAGCAIAYLMTGVFRRRMERQVLGRFEVRRISGGEC